MIFLASPAMLNKTEKTKTRCLRVKNDVSLLICDKVSAVVHTIAFGS